LTYLGALLVGLQGIGFDFVPRSPLKIVHMPAKANNGRSPLSANQTIQRLFRAMNRYVGNLPPMTGVFPVYPAPVVRNASAEREMALMRWGMPPPPRTGGPPVTNIRNTSSPHWRMWLKPENRCLVPANSFAEYAPEPNPESKKKDVVASWLVVIE
jgi:putative SOS response-associated peptidase YedK